MKNPEKRNLHAISAQFRKAGSHKDEKRDKKTERRRARDQEQHYDNGRKDDDC